MENSALISKFQHSSLGTSNTDNYGGNRYYGGSGGPPMDRLDQIDNRLKAVEGKVTQIEGRLNTIEDVVLRTEKRMDGLEDQMKSLKTEMGSLQSWTMGTVIGGFALIICVLSLFTAWFIHDSNRNWDRTQQTLDQIHAIELRMERSQTSWRQWPAR